MLQAIRTLPSVSDARREEFRLFAASRSSSLLRSAMVLTGDRQLAEDLVQEALARTFLAWGRIRNVGNAEAYARRVMYHQAFAGWRRRRISESPVADVPDRPAGQHAADPDTRIALRTALFRLTPRQRAVLVLRYYEDMAEADVAALLGCSVGTVKSQTHKALARLRLIAPELTDLHVEGRTP